MASPFWDSMEPYHNKDYFVKMNLWQKIIKNPYRWLIWQWLGGRPLTYQLRDLWHKGEYVWIIVLIAVGVTMGHHFDWLEVLKILGVFTIGFILGHVFWGKVYWAGQR